MENLARAMSMALGAHAGVMRKGTEIPYISHLLQVAGLTFEFGGDETEAIGALLHDAAEDAGGETMLQRIRTEFGPDVELIVRENSDSITGSKAEKAPWQQRKQAYIAAIAGKSESSCLVSIADKLHNVRALTTDQLAHGDAHWKRFNATKDQTLWYFGSLVEAFRKRAVTAARLKNPVSQLERAVEDLHEAVTCPPKREI